MIFSFMRSKVDREQTKYPFRLMASRARPSTHLRCRQMAFYLDCTIAHKSQQYEHRGKSH